MFVFLWSRYVYIPECFPTCACVIHTSSASQSFPGMLPTWHAELVTRSLLEVTFWMSNTNFSPLMIHLCIKDMSVLIQFPSMKFQFWCLLCQLVYKCVIHSFLGKSLINAICILIFHSSYLFTWYFLIKIWNHVNWAVTFSSSHKSLSKSCYN